jgi:RimJ/RimL family protein N-acetyltransferase
VRIVLSVEAGNARAARLYEKCGFVELDTCGFVELDTPPPLRYEPHFGTRFYAYTL